MARSLDGKVVLVTGVTAGIGRELARRLTAQGATVVGCARDRERLAVVAAELPRLVAVPCDLRDSAERAALVQAALDRCGRIDVLVHNAGFGYVGAVVDMAAEDIESIVATNVTAFIDLTRLVLPGMLGRGAGEVLVISSVATWIPMPPLTAYAATKRGVDGFVAGLRREVGKRGIRVHSVNPGFVATEFHARSLGMRPRENDPGVRPTPGISPARVADRAIRELRSSRGRTVAVPRVLGVTRLLTVPPFSTITDMVLRIAAPTLIRKGRAVAEERAPGARAEASVGAGPDERGRS